MVGGPWSTHHCTHHPRIFKIYVPVRKQGHVVDYLETRNSNDQPLLHFAWELMWSEPKFTGLRSLNPL